MELPRLEAPSEVTLTDHNDWKVRFRDYVVLTRLMEEIPSVLGRQAELRAALAPPWSKLWQTGRLRVEDNDDVEEVLEKLGVYLRGQRNPLLDRREFFLRNQLKMRALTIMSRLWLCWTIWGTTTIASCRAPVAGSPVNTVRRTETEEYVTG